MATPHRPTTYSSPSIPPELSDRIIDYLHDDALALSACSLTCRAWLPRTRHNRFKNIAVDAISCQGLLKLLARTPDICSLARNLAICYRTNYRIGLSRRTAWDEKTLSALLALLPNVQRLDLDTLDVTVATARVLKDNLPGVQALRLTRVHLKDMGVLFALFLSFPQLRELQLVDVFLIHTTARPTAVPLVDRASTATLTTLRFPSRITGDIVAPSFIRWLLSHQLHRSIETVQIPDLRKADIATFESLLASLGPTLRHLSVSFADMEQRSGTTLDTQDNPYGAVSLKYCTVLRTFGLCINIVPQNLLQEQQRRPQMLSWVPELLDTMSSQFLEHIHLRIKAGGAEHRDIFRVDWARVADVLSGNRFIHLRRLTFEIIRGGGIRPAIIHIKDQVADLNRKLDVRFSERT